MGMTLELSRLEWQCDFNRLGSQWGMQSIGVGLGLQWIGSPFGLNRMGSDLELSFNRFGSGWGFHPDCKCICVFDTEFFNFSGVVFMVYAPMRYII